MDKNTGFETQVNDMMYQTHTLIPINDYSSSNVFVPNC